jgi:hypothetical protein
VVFGAYLGLTGNDEYYKVRLDTFIGEQKVRHNGDISCASWLKKR